MLQDFELQGWRIYRVIFGCIIVLASCRPCCAEYYFTCNEQLKWGGEAFYGEKEIKPLLSDERKCLQIEDKRYLLFNHVKLYRFVSKEKQIQNARKKRNKMLWNWEWGIVFQRVVFLVLLILIIMNPTILTEMLEGK